MDKGAATAEGGTPAPRGVTSSKTRMSTDNGKITGIYEFYAGND